MRFQATAVVVTLLVAGAAFTSWRAFSPSKASVAHERVAPALDAADLARDQRVDALRKPFPDMPDPMSAGPLPPLVSDPQGVAPGLGINGAPMGPPGSKMVPAGLFGPGPNGAGMPGPMPGGMPPMAMRPGGPGVGPEGWGPASGPRPGEMSAPLPPSMFPLGVDSLGLMPGPDPAAMVLPDMPNPLPSAAK